MKIKLEPNRKLAKVKGRKYPDIQRKFLGAYLSQIVDFGFIKPSTQATWLAAPHLVPKKFASKFRTKIDLRPVNATTIYEQGPMPNIRAEVSDFKGCANFSSLDFCAGYLKCPLDPSAYATCGTIAP